jgi:hypothetical protein
MVCEPLQGLPCCVAVTTRRYGHTHRVSAAPILREHVMCAASEVCSPVHLCCRLRGKRGAQLIDESCSNGLVPMVAKLSARPNFNSQDSPDAPMACTLPRLHGGGVEVRDGAARQTLGGRPKHARTDLPAQFMIGPLERAALGMRKRF